MELKRLGLARKPMFTVPNHMLGQFLFRTAHPLSEREHFGGDTGGFREGQTPQLMSRIATGNWDAIIVTHSGF